MRNLRIGVNKLVGYVSINLLGHPMFIASKSAACVISIISDVLAVCVEAVHLTSGFVTTAALLCQHVIVNKRM